MDAIDILMRHRTLTGLLGFIVQVLLTLKAARIWISARSCSCPETE